MTITTEQLYAMQARTNPARATKPSIAQRIRRQRERIAIVTEKNMHVTFVKWCAMQKIIAVHARMDQRSTIAKGAWDFHLLKNGRGCAVEFKMPGKMLTPEQLDYALRLARSHVPDAVAYSVDEAIEFARKALNL
jgi:hypothetical protein